MPSIAPRRRPMFRAFPIALLAGALAATSARAQGVVEGRVLDEKTGQPVAGASVQVGVLVRTHTNDNGEFRLRLPGGVHDAVVRRIGYQPQGARWTVGRDTLRVTVGVAPEALALAEVRVVTNRYVERLETRLRAYAFPTRSFDRDRLEKSVSPNAADFIRYQTGLFRAPCPAGALVAIRTLDCVLIRMQTYPLNVTIDERPAFGGLRELETYPIDEIGRVEVLNGRFVRVYTNRFLEQSGRIGRIPL